MQIGIIIAQLINYGTVEIYEYGWRISLAIAAVPAFMILAGGVFLPETPSSLISRNRFEEGRRVRLSSLDTMRPFMRLLLPHLSQTTCCCCAIQRFGCACCEHIQSPLCTMPNGVHSALSSCQKVFSYHFTCQDGKGLGAK